ncbi:MAG: amidohydrolase family protein [Acidimicrobiia bacterium]
MTSDLHTEPRQLVITDARLADGRRVDIVITGERITEIVDHTPGVPRSVASTGVDTFDAAGMLALAAFVEPHAHLDKALSAERAPNPRGDLGGAIEAWIGYGPQLTVTDMADRAERCARMLLANGATVIRSHADVHGAVGLRAAEALIEARRRLAGLVTVEITALIGWPSTGEAGVEERARLAAALDMGVDHIGGCPYLEPDPLGAIDASLAMAAERGIGLDLHVDETLDPAILTVETLAERVVATGFDGPVMASHCVSLGMQSSAVQQRVADKVAAAGISVVALPQTNLYLQSRALATAPPRGLTAIAALRTAGVNVAGGADNVQDPFNLVGRGDPLETAALLVMAGHLSPDDALEAVSSRARRALGHEPVTLTPGSLADLVVIDAGSVREAVASGSATRTVVRHGRIVSSRRLVEQ